MNTIARPHLIFDLQSTGSAEKVQGRARTKDIYTESVHTNEQFSTREKFYS